MTKCLKCQAYKIIQWGRRVYNSAVNKITSQENNDINENSKYKRKYKIIKGNEK